MSDYIPNLDAFIDYSIIGNRAQPERQAENVQPNPPHMFYPSYQTYSNEHVVHQHQQQHLPHPPPHPPAPVAPSEEWKPGYISLNVPPFTGSPGLNSPVPDTELGFFKLIMNRFIILYMVQELNKFAKVSLGEHDFSEFVLVSPEEMYDFICLLMYMGVSKLPAYEMYWRKHHNPFYQEFPRTLMTYERFMIIKKYFQVFDNEANNETDESAASFLKLEELVGHFSNVFASVYTPDRELALDENLCSWSSLGGTKLFIPPKSSNYDMNLYAMCEGKSGYICSLMMHSSTSSEKNIDMVLNISKNFHHKNHRLYMDNFFTSIPLFEELKKVGLFCCGTQREVGSGPRGFRVGIKKLKNSEAFMKHNGSVNCLELSDSLGSVILTNMHPDNGVLTEVDDNEANPGLIKDARQSHIAQQFNTFTGGVDLMNQMVKYYEVEKRSKKWTTRLCIHVLNVAFYNSYCLYKNFCRTKPNAYLQYLIDITRGLQAENHGAPAQETAPTQPAQIVTDVDNQDKAATSRPKKSPDSKKIIHFPVIMDKRKRCAYCIKQKKRREILSKCGRCDVPLCHIDCFEKYHNE